MSQLRIFKEKGFPLPRKLNSEDVHQHLVPNSCNTLLKHTIPSEHTPVPFCCKCKGKIMLI